MLPPHKTTDTDYQPEHGDERKNRPASYKRYRSEIIHHTNPHHTNNMAPHDHNPEYLQHNTHCL